jgi:hypothetical protein
MGSEQDPSATNVAAAAAPSTTEHALRQRKDDSHAPGSTSSGGSPLNDRDKLRISLLRNARYHEDRERFFARIHKVAMFFVVAGGTSILASFFSQVFFFAALVTLAGLLDLVFDVSGRARQHASLRRRIYDVLAQTEDPDRATTKLQEQAIQIYADEPPCMHAVNMLAYNEAMSSFGRPKKAHIKLTGPQRFLRHWFSYGSVQFKTFEEIEREKSSASM